MHLVMEYCSLGDLSLFIKKKGLIQRQLPEGIQNPFENPIGGLNDIITRTFLRQIGNCF